MSHLLPPRKRDIDEEARFFENVRGFIHDCRGCFDYDIPIEWSEERCSGCPTFELSTRRNL